MVISFDSGTTNTKAFLFSDNARLIASASHPTKIFYRGPGIVEQDAEDWWQALCRAAEKLYEAHKWRKNDIEAIGISSQGGTFALLGGDLKPLAPAITWLDNRGASMAKKMSSEKSRNYFYSRTGHEIKGWSPPAVCRWFRKNEPAAAAETGRISFVADYLNYRLTDTFFIDPTSAQMSCLYNIRKNAWDKEILKAARIGEASLPLLLASNSTGGKTTKKSAGLLNIREGTPVVAGGHDQYCASLGADAGKKGDCLLSCGTSWVLLLTADRLVFIPGSGWTPGRYIQENRFGLMAAIGNAGIILEWMRNNIRIGKKRGDIKTGVVVIPDFSIQKGTIKNISLATGGNEIYYAAMESLIMKIKKRLDEVESVSPVKRLFMVGGATKERFLPEMVEKITGKELVMPEVTEAAGRGAALLALNRNG